MSIHVPISVKLFRFSRFSRNNTQFFPLKWNDFGFIEFSFYKFNIFFIFFHAMKYSTFFDITNPHLIYEFLFMIHFLLILFEQKVCEFIAANTEGLTICVFMSRLIKFLNKITKKLSFILTI